MASDTEFRTNEIWSGWDPKLQRFMAILRRATPCEVAVGIGLTEVEAHENLIGLLEGSNG